MTAHRKIFMYLVTCLSSIGMLSAFNESDDFPYAVDWETFEDMSEAWEDGEMSSSASFAEELTPSQRIEKWNSSSSYFSKETLLTYGIKPYWRKSQYSSAITSEIWSEVSPYLVDDVLLKRALDKIFSGKRILDSVESLEKAGFSIIFQQLNRGLIVARHPHLPKHLVKLYLDSSPREEQPLWLLRVQGAHIIQQLISKYGLGRYLKVPQKWIYPITKAGRPVASDSIFPKDFVLVVQDMRLCSPKINIRRYKTRLTHAHLKALHRVITEGGLSDSHIKNIPLSKDGKLAFIDTEYVNVWPIYPEWLTRYFSSSNQEYWNQLIQGGG